MRHELTNVPDDDESHPIPHLSKIDVTIHIKNGDYYGIETRSPLTNDVVTRTRLLKKLDSYLGDIHSESAVRRRGSALPGKLRIYVGLYQSSDKGIVDFVESCRPWLEDNGVQLHIKYLDSEGGQLSLDREPN